jgi:hypothetical protein
VGAALKGPSEYGSNNISMVPTSLGGGTDSQLQPVDYRALST